MEKEEEKKSVKKNGISRMCEENYKIIDLSNQELTVFPDKLEISSTITELFLPHNKLEEVPYIILNLENIKILDISHNKIQYFDDTPNFYSQIEQLNLSHNNLKGPPYWVWAESPQQLKYLNLSNNIHLTHSFRDGYFEELLQYECLVTHIKINNCYLNQYIEIIGTFPNTKNLDIGCEDLNNLFYANTLPDLPCKGLEKCCGIEKLNVSNTQVSLVHSNIEIFKSLREINLAENRLSGLPQEFCQLKNLEVCILSYNNIMYLPEEFDKLIKLTVLAVDSNEMCMLPNISNFPNLVKLDLYDNKLYDIPEGIDHVQEIDMAQNFFDEPTEPEYILKKQEIRITKEGRKDGRKEEENISEKFSSSESLEDLSNDIADAIKNYEASHCSSESLEDWDSDDYWEPHYMNHAGPSRSPWLMFVHKKMAEGNFCPMDAHVVSVSEKVKYEKMYFPKVLPEVPGQFDDLSEDDL